ncbi:hypothetical protein HNQ91_000680 [Filimonas zeae]|uniref:Uncharacterized protein n=1 Tax=Filimonas zeae TaxID=1737353 RepID=A0A917IQN6_9BACT|nr:hypothetical protein [Filimonas zeae]MDR6337658.1 hypothetical protein [Filimonas zeae]GGH59666.1 hypothetical protein GCM10011379_06690 [Filimonas zeae]
MQKKISERYWYSLNLVEQNYVRQRLSSDTIPVIKLIISEARKQHPGFTQLYGKGFIKTATGETLLWTGEDTRRFKQLPKTPAAEDAPIHI